MSARLFAGPTRRGTLAGVFAFLAVTAACSDSPTEPDAGPNQGTLTVAANDSAFVRFTSDTVVVVPAGAAGWDVGFWQTAVFLNGSGSDPVTGTCICQNQGATNEQVMAMSPASELADFDAVTTVPGGATWSSALFAEQPWYRYNLTGTDHQIWPTYDVFLVRRGSDVFKVQLIGYYDAAGEPRNITFRYARLTG